MCTLSSQLIHRRSVGTIGVGLLHSVSVPCITDWIQFVTGRETWDENPQDDWALLWHATVRRILISNIISVNHHMWETPDRHSQIARFSSFMQYPSSQPPLSPQFLPWTPDSTAWYCWEIRNKSGAEYPGRHWANISADVWYQHLVSQGGWSSTGAHPRLKALTASCINDGSTSN